MNFIRASGMKLEGNIPDNWRKIKERFKLYKKTPEEHKQEDEEEEEDEIAKLQIALDRPEHKSDASDDVEFKSFIDTIIMKFLMNIQLFLKEQEPLVIAELPIKSINDNNVQVKLSVTELNVYNASSFVVNKLKNHFFRMTQEFNLTFPELEYHGNYVTSGKILKSTVKGKGRINVWMKDLVTWGKAYASIVKGKVHIKQLDLDYNLKAITVKATGLKVQGKSDKEVQQLISKQLLRYFTENERLVCDTISSLVLEQTNQILENMSVKEILNWLQHFKPHPQ